MELGQKESAEVERQEAPSADRLFAKVVVHYPDSLQHKIEEGLTGDFGIFHLEGKQYVWALDWFVSVEAIQFKLVIYCVKPRSFKEAMRRSWTQQFNKETVQ